MYKIYVILILSTILLVGCNNSDKTQSVISNLESENIEIKKVNDDLQENNEVLRAEVNTIQIENDVLNNKIDEYETEILHLNTNIEDLNYLINSQSQQIKDYDLEVSNKGEEGVIDYSAIEIGGYLDGFKVISLENTSHNFSIDLEGYFLLEGDFYPSEMGGTTISFIGSDLKKDQPFKAKIKVGEYNLELRSGFGITNNDEVKSLLGDELYNKICNEGNKIHAVAVFKDYSYNAYWESEIDLYAEIVSIIEIGGTR